MKKYYLSTSFIIFSFVIFLETAFYYLFKTIFTESAIFIAFDTNSKETKEFIGFYIDRPIIFSGVVMLILTLLALYKLNKHSFQFQPIGRKIALLVLSIVVVLKFSGLIIYNLPYMVVRSAVLYYVESKKLAEYAINKNGDFTFVQRTFDEDEDEIYVIIIGESTARSHLGIYNYYRNTTPLLDEIKNDLLIYNKVISPDTYTIASLTKALTLGNYENPDGKFDGSIIQLLNQAGFQTYWISAQKPLGANDSHITKIGMGANESYFMNIKNAKEETVFDEVLVEKMNEVLSGKANKKVVFLHTLGTHMNYKNRYPESFKFFNDVPETKFNDKHIYDQINAYDNAVRYTDYIINKVIESIKNTNTVSCVLYFSDHGEEVYDDIEFAGHYRDRVQTKNVYEIPLILWQSENYKNKRVISSLNLDTKYMIDDLFHSMADLFCIKSNEVDSSRSIFSEYFKERKRIVFDTVNYDIYFKD
ncbi:phosphoethanolamine transferase [Sabulilitoribacter multivorans]|uniref:Phosphoethanolamine transferase n=1 Tax=Flaviramulus multivorans TaxID=1304750 RepID=A0ABS9IJ41_9FLAO|nr:phosphoethanolamine transferase [Flaviramulus multivorans]